MAPALRDSCPWDVAAGQESLSIADPGGREAAVPPATLADLAAVTAACLAVLQAAKTSYQHATGGGCEPARPKAAFPAGRAWSTVRRVSGKTTETRKEEGW
jgi:hypothetical protein